MPLNNYGVIPVDQGALGRCAQPDAHGCRLIGPALQYDTVWKLNTDQEFDHITEVQLLGPGVTLTYMPTLSLLQPSRHDVEASVGELAALVTAGHRVLVHCQHGRDRTGLIIGAYEILVLRWPIARVLDEFGLYGMTAIASLVDQPIRDLLRTLAEADT